ncbi:MAG TPA: glycosyltransferase [Dehalococcoidia bacterium]|jgi:cellulose synthase/poly-beta-1,6-N-acetylglucosamine synthase-like glycosyltransferase|nr:glycosyltransferase [Dehalococcoidia bacterium]
MENAESKKEKGGRPGLDLISKKNTMYLLILTLWAVSLVLLAVHAALTYGLPKTGLLWFLVVLAALCMAVFWFYALYHYGLVLFRRIGRVSPEMVKPEGEENLPRIALIYTTVDDFKYEAALSCVSQDYPNFHVFLIDVSQGRWGREQVEEFHKKFPDKTTIFRRERLEGFKARSLNLCLEGPAKGYEFFALCDADGILAKDFLRKAALYIQQDARIGFVQANHNSGSSTRNAFTEHFLAETQIRWEHNNVPRNHYGFPLMLGHGVLVRTEAYLKAGGFPEVVAEDVAFTIAMRHAGYSGFFAEDIVCSEGVPENLEQMRKRTYRMTMADTETFVRHTVPFIKSASASFAEKWDIMAHTLRRTATSLFLPYLVLLLATSFVSLGAMTTAAWGLVVFGWLAGASALARVIVSRYRTPAKLFRHLSQVTCVYVSFYLHTFIAILAFLIARRAYFLVTGAKVEEKARPRLTLRQRIARLNPNSRWMVSTSVILALLLLGLAIYSSNLALIGLALAMLSPLIQGRFGWKRVPAEATAWLALLLIVAGAILGPLGIIGPQWQFLVPVGFSVMIRT